MSTRSDRSDQQGETLDLYCTNSYTGHRRRNASAVFFSGCQCCAHVGMCSRQTVGDVDVAMTATDAGNGVRDNLNLRKLVLCKKIKR